MVVRVPAAWRGMFPDCPVRWPRRESGWPSCRFARGLKPGGWIHRAAAAAGSVTCNGRSLGELRGLRLRTADPAPVSGGLRRGQHRPVQSVADLDLDPTRTNRALETGYAGSAAAGRSCRERITYALAAASGTPRRTTGILDSYRALAAILAGASRPWVSTRGSIEGPCAQDVDCFGRLSWQVKCGELAVAGRKLVRAGAHAGDTVTSCSIAACPLDGGSGGPGRSVCVPGCQWARERLRNRLRETATPWRMQMDMPGIEGEMPIGNPWRARLPVGFATMPGWTGRRRHAGRGLEGAARWPRVVMRTALGFNLR